MNELGELLTKEQVAKWLQIHPRQVERLGIPQYVVTRKLVRFRPADVTKWLEGYKSNGKRNGGRA